MQRQLFDSAPDSAGRYHEMFDAAGQVRLHWLALSEELETARPELMRRRLDNLRHQIHENGVTYNVYADPQGAERPWELDLLPFILPHEEWQQIEAAVAQRATLLNRILADVYGNQCLLRDGLLPPALVHGHAGFLRPAHDIACPDDTYLHFYAADLARAPDGNWWVIADRTQAPSGAGYALENRLVISRQFPELFRDLKVQHLASFFRTLQESLAHWAPRDDGTPSATPRIVLLTPGPYNETYFEHAYLARYLGFPLVEGSDLLVRDGCVWMKTLDGLQRVHVILRRLDDDYCDPLELRPDSTLGVPGLTQVARTGKVLIANALGSSLLESGALYGYLPGLCQSILGEPLKMPSVATWWCGEPAALEDALGKLDALVIKGAFPQLRLPSVFGADLGEAGRAKLIEAIRARPYNYVAQEQVSLSQAPTWEQGQPELGERAMVLRVFAVATPSGYAVMPGGLTRVAGHNDARMIAMQRGGTSKDTWVLTRDAISTVSLLRREIRPQELVRSGANLSSRMVENLFWFGRYAERCDNAARLLRTALARFIDDDAEQADEQAPQRNAIVALCRQCGILAPAASDGEAGGSMDDSALLRAVTEADSPGGFAANLKQLARVGSQLRERLSLDNWRTLNRLVQELETQRQLQQDGGNLGEALAFLDQAAVGLMTMAGFAMDGMTRDHGWRFLSIGRRTERLQFYSTVLGQLLADPLLRNGDLDWLLELADSIVTYRSRYMMQPQLLPVLDQLLLDEANPRSVLFQVRGLDDYLKRLAGQFGPFECERLDELAQRLGRIDLGSELKAPAGIELPRLLADLRGAAFALSDQIGLRFFSHVVDQHSV
jgi:uncharacterized circularly permuted ATP-grasp superfamily protein/uncharacterized alpha-E superfamily protein